MRDNNDNFDDLDNIVSNFLFLIVFCNLRSPTPISETIKERTKRYCISHINHKVNTIVKDVMH